MSNPTLNSGDIIDRIYHDQLVYVCTVEFAYKRGGFREIKFETLLLFMAPEALETVFDFEQVDFLDMWAYSGTNVGSLAREVEKATITNVGIQIPLNLIDVKREIYHHLGESPDDPTPQIELRRIYTRHEFKNDNHKSR